MYRGAIPRVKNAADGGGPHHRLVHGSVMGDEGHKSNLLGFIQEALRRQQICNAHLLGKKDAVRCVEGKAALAM